MAINPTANIDLPAARGRRERVADPLEAAALIAAVPDQDRALWATAMYAGLGRGELRALRCSDVNLGGSEIRVERGWDRHAGPIEPKSEASIRTIPLLAVLRDHIDEHLLRTSGAGEDLIFGRSPSESFDPTSVQARARRAWLAAGCESITLHECRHTFASLLIAAGTNPKGVQEYMGHASITQTFDRSATYSPAAAMRPEPGSTPISKPPAGQYAGQRCMISAGRGGPRRVDRWLG